VPAIVLVGGVGVQLDLVVFLQAALGLLQPLGPRPGNRARLPRTALVQAPARIAQPPLTALRRGQLLGQLVTARVAEALVLFGVDGVGVLEDLARDLLIIARGVMRGVGVDLRAIAIAAVAGVDFTRLLVLRAGACRVPVCPCLVVR
jgi:hypothetical protein